MTLAAAGWGGLAPSVAGAATAVNARQEPPTLASDAVSALAPVNLHAFARSVGGEVAWIERNKKLRLRHPRHEIVFAVDRREIAVDGLRVFLGEAPKLGDGSLQVLAVDRDRVLLPLLAPQMFKLRLPIRTIMLDAGHGGRDQGTRSDPLKLREKDLALDVVQRLERLLAARGFSVVLSRTDDTFIDLGERPKLAQLAQADLFLSVHFNAGPPSVHGIEVYRVTPQFERSTASSLFTPEDNKAVPGNAWDAWNTLLGFAMHRQLHRELQRFDRGFKHARFVVLRDLAACPGVLIECGYLSNPAEAKWVSLSAQRERIAAAIAAGVDAYFGLFSALDVPATSSADPSEDRGGDRGGGGAIRAPRTSSLR